MNDLVFNRHASRWYPLKDHPVQLELVQAVPNGVRFPLVPAGRRSGKTERFKRFLSKEAMSKPNEQYFAGAPTRGQAKRIFWNDLKLLTFSEFHPKSPSETELKIFLPNGTTIEVVGLDEPKRIEGTNWTGGGIDEIADVKEEALDVNIMPALNTVDPRRPDYRPWCWFLGVPDGLNHYYKMVKDAESGANPDAKVFHWKSAEILPPDVIEAAKKRMSKKQFAQEFEASFETATGRIYEDYNSENVTHSILQEHEQICWFHDFNYSPLSSGIAVKRKIEVDGLSAEGVFVVDEIVLTSAIALQAAMEFVEKFKNHRNRSVIIYGDPSGRAGEKHSHASDYSTIESHLRQNGWNPERRVKSSTRSIKDGQNAVRARIANSYNERFLFVNPNTAPTIHNGFLTCEYKKGSTFIEEETYYQHIISAIRYFIDYDYPVTMGGTGDSNVEISGGL